MFNLIYAVCDNMVRTYPKSDCVFNESDGSMVATTGYRTSARYAKGKWFRSSADATRFANSKLASLKGYAGRKLNKTDRPQLKAKLTTIINAAENAIKLNNVVVKMHGN